MFRSFSFLLSGQRAFDRALPSLPSFPFSRNECNTTLYIFSFVPAVKFVRPLRIHKNFFVLHVSLPQTFVHPIYCQQGHQIDPIYQKLAPIQAQRTKYPEIFCTLLVLALLLAPRRIFLSLGFSSEFVLSSSPLLPGLLCLLIEFRYLTSPPPLSPPLGILPLHCSLPCSLRWW